MSVYSAEQLSELATHLSSIEDWLRQDCTARHAEDMADVVHQAFQVVDDLYDERAPDTDKSVYDRGNRGPAMTMSEINRALGIPKEEPMSHAEVAPADPDPLNPCEGCGVPWDEDHLEGCSEA